MNYDIGTVVTLNGGNDKYMIIRRYLVGVDMYNYACFPMSRLKELTLYNIAKLKDVVIVVEHFQISSCSPLDVSPVISLIFDALFYSAPPSSSSDPISQPTPIGQTDPILDHRFRDVDQRMAKREEQVEAQIDDLTKRMADLEKAHLVNVCQSIRPYHIHSLGHDCLQVQMSQRGRCGMNQSGCPHNSTMPCSGPSHMGFVHHGPSWGSGSHSGESVPRQP